MSSADIYVHMTLVLASVVLVLIALILYIVHQTLQLKQQYAVLREQLSDEDKIGWISRKESEAPSELNVEYVPICRLIKLTLNNNNNNNYNNRKGSAMDIQTETVGQSSKFEKMLTFIRKSLDGLDRVGQQPQQQHRHQQPNTISGNGMGHRTRGQRPQLPPKMFAGTLPLKNTYDVTELSEYCVPP